METEVSVDEAGVEEAVPVRRVVLVAAALLEGGDGRKAARRAWGAPGARKAEEPTIRCAVASSMVGVS